MSESSSNSYPEDLQPGARVIVGMSGGVDSSVAARLLLDAGFDVAGLFMKNWEEDDGTEYCTAIEDHEDAAGVCAKLGIQLHTANFAAEYWDGVFEAFLAEYRAGRTPNPDVLCNREIKFRHFADYARELGADAIATGHYVRGVHGRGADRARFELHKGIDPGKDQSYFLQAVTPTQFRNTVFPLGTLHKDRVRQLADGWGFHNARKKDSTGICFIGERRFSDFLARYVPRRPGPVRDPAGRTLGEHTGLAYYTLGQRQGLGIGGRRGRLDAPWYVSAKHMATNELIVTQDPADLDSTWLVASSPNWLAPGFDIEACAHLTARVRYRQADQRCRASRRADGRWLVRFDTPQRAVTPGQYVCFYAGSRCLGGAVIESSGRTLP